MLTNFLNKIKEIEEELAQELVNLLKFLKDDNILLEDETLLKVHKKLSELVDLFEKNAIKNENKELPLEEKIYLEETAQNLLELVIFYWEILEKLNKKLGIAIPIPQSTSYSTIQEIVNKSKISNNEKQNYIKKCKNLKLPTRGFNKKSFFGFFYNKKELCILIGFIITILTLFLSDDYKIKLTTITIALVCFIFCYNNKKITGLKYIIARMAISLIATLIVLFFLDLSSLQLKLPWLVASGSVVFLLSFYYKNPPSSDNLK